MYLLWITFLYIGCAWSQNFDLGSLCEVDDNGFQRCEVDLELENCGSTGWIQTPNYPNPLDYSEPSRSGNYKFILKTCPLYVIFLRLYVQDGDYAFKLMSTGNTFRVGNGDVFNANLMSPVLTGNGGNELPDGNDEYTYEARSNQMWVELNAPDNGALFRIEYFVSKSNISEVTFTEKRGWLNSSYFSSEAYPKGVEYRYFIDTTEESESDLLLTVHSLNITGSYDFGDYLLLGPGLDWEKSTHSVLMSWSLEPGIKLLINGSTAHLVFKTTKGSDTSGYDGFSIYYEVIDKNLTTPSPPTTTAVPPTTPIPLEISKLSTTVVFLNTSKTLANRKFQEVIAELLNDYLISHDHGDGWNLLEPNITKEAIMSTSSAGRCFSGWSVDKNVCAQFVFYVESFKTNGSVIEPTFLREDIEDAVRKSKYYNREVTLPDDLTNIYIWAIVIVAVVALLVLTGSLLFWRMRVIQHYREKKRYTNINSSNSENKKAALGSSVTVQGYDNPTFVSDELDSLRTYNPESRTLQSRSTAYGTASNGRTRSLSQNRESESSTDITTSSSEDGTQKRRTTDSEDVPKTPPRSILKRNIFLPAKLSTSEEQSEANVSMDSDASEPHRSSFASNEKRTVILPLEPLKQEPKRSSVRRTVVQPMQLDAATSSEEKLSSFQQTVLPRLELKRQNSSRNHVRRTVVAPMRLPTSQNGLNDMMYEMEEVTLYDSGPSAHSFQQTRIPKAQLSPTKTSEAFIS